MLRAARNEAFTFISWMTQELPFTFPQKGTILSNAANIVKYSMKTGQAHFYFRSNHLAHKETEGVSGD